MKNNVIFNLKQSIGIGLGKGTRIRVSEDYETGKVINTSGEIVSVVLKNDTQIERFEASFSDGFMTIEKRGLNKNKNVAEEEVLKKQWNEGEMGYITVFAHNLFDASKSITIKEGEKIYFGNSDVYLTQNDGNLKIKDRNNNEISLSDIASKTGQNNKVSISDEDVNAGFLKDKLGKGFKFGTKVDIDLSKVDNSGILLKDLTLEDEIILANGKKAKIGSLIASEEDMKNGSPGKIITSEMSGGELVLYESEELLNKITVYRYGGNTSSIHDNYRNYREVEKIFEVTCLLNGTYRVGGEYSGRDGGYVGELYFSVEGSKSEISGGFSGNMARGTRIAKHTFTDLKKGDKIKVYAGVNVRLLDFRIYGLLQRKIVKTVVE